MPVGWPPRIGSGSLRVDGSGGQNHAACQEWEWDCPVSDTARESFCRNRGKFAGDNPKRLGQGGSVEPQVLAKYLASARSKMPHMLAREFAPVTRRGPLLPAMTTDAAASVLFRLSPRSSADRCAAARASRSPPAAWRVGPASARRRHRRWTNNGTKARMIPAKRAGRSGMAMSLGRHRARQPGTPPSSRPLGPGRHTIELRVSITFFTKLMDGEPRNPSPTGKQQNLVASKKSGRVKLPCEPVVRPDQLSDNL